MTGESFDVVIIGGGPGGSTLAIDLARAGLSVLIVEKHRFPRYHIGESLTGMAGEILRELGLGAEMDRRQFPIKGGVKVIGKAGKAEFFVPVLAPTWQVRRAEFDDILVEKAVAEGAVHRLGTVQDVLREGERVAGVTYVPEGSDRPTAVRARFTVDASGMSNVFFKLGVTGGRTEFDFARQVAVFTQFRGAVRDPGEMGNNTFIFYNQTYEWAWFIPISPDVVSVGVVVPVERLREQGGDPDKLMAWGLDYISADLGGRCAGCPQLEPVRAIRDYSYDIRPYAGDGWLCVGDSHRFIDPIFSFGVGISMLEARAAGQAITSVVRGGAGSAEALARYVDYCDSGQDVALDVLRFFWKYPVFFGYQIRGKQRRNFIRLLGSDLYTADQNELIHIFREQMRNAPESDLAR